MARNKFVTFRPRKLETLTLLKVKENLYMNFLQTIIYFLVNKNCIVILFLCYMIPFVAKSLLHFLFHVEVPLGFKLERIFSKTTCPNIFQTILCWIDKCNLFSHKRTLIWCSCHLN